MPVGAACPDYLYRAPTLSIARAYTFTDNHCLYMHNTLISIPYILGVSQRDRFKFMIYKTKAQRQQAAIDRNVRNKPFKDNVLRLKKSHLNQSMSVTEGPAQRRSTLMKGSKKVYPCESLSVEEYNKRRAEEVTLSLPSL